MSDYKVTVSGDETINIETDNEESATLSPSTGDSVPVSFTEDGEYALGFVGPSSIGVTPASTITVNGGGGAVDSVNGYTGDVVLNTGDLENVSGYITSDDIPSDLSDFDNDVGYITSVVTDLGTINLEDYDYDFLEYLNDKTANGFFRVYDEADGFYYYFKVEATDSDIYQEYWCSEEGSRARTARSGRKVDDEWEFNDTTYIVFGSDIEANYYNKSQVYTKSEINDMLGSYYTDYQVDEILENNYYTSDQVDELLDDFAPENMKETTWANLVALRDGGHLTKGVYYRITDYNFVTTKANVRSGNHPFDIVVLAISESMLSESAYAVRHQGDTYYEREVTSDGIQWLYTIYVDYMGENYGTEPTDHTEDLHASDTFCDYDYLEHPDTGDEVPVLYKTDIEEYDIDDPDYEDAYFYEGTYDFDGDEYDMWSKWEFNGRDWIFQEQYALTPIVVEDGELIVSPTPETKTVPVNLNAWELKYCLDNDKSLFEWAVPEGKGVIYYMKDEFGNEAPYDFKNVMFRRKKITSTGNSILNSFIGQYVGEDDYYMVNCGSDSKFFYTFVSSEDDTADGSLYGACNYNIIKPYILDGQRMLNNLVMHNATRNTFGFNCSSCTLTASCHSAVFGDECTNLLLNGCGKTVIDGVARNCTFVVFGNNKVGTNFSQNFGAQTSDSSFGAMCQNNNFGVGANGNEIGMGFMNNTFGNNCSQNKIGNTVMQSTFGTYCSYNNIEGNNNNISFTNYYRYCTIERTCSNISLNTSSGSTTNYVQYVTVKKGVSNLTVAPTRKLAYETIYYKTGRTENAV